MGAHLLYNVAMKTGISETVTATDTVNARINVASWPISFLR